MIVKFFNECYGLEDPVEIAIQKSENHPSIMSLKGNNVSLESFKFHKINLDNILKKLNKLDSTKNGTFGDIPPKCLNLSSNEIPLHLLHIWTIKSLTKISYSLS